MNYITGWQMRKCSELHSALTHSSMGWDLLWVRCAQGSTACWKSLGLPDLKLTLDLAQVLIFTLFPFPLLAGDLSRVPVVHCTLLGFAISVKLAPYTGTGFKLG